MPQYYNYNGSGSDESDLMFGTAGATTLTGGAGADVMVGEGSFTGPLSGGSSIATAVNLDSGLFFWATGENPLLFDNGVTPYTSIAFVADAGQTEYFVINLNAGATLTVDFDYYGLESNYVDAVVEILSVGGTKLADNDDASTTLGGLGSIVGLDPFLSFTAPTNGTYYIHIRPYTDTAFAPFATNSYHLLNISVTGHSASVLNFTGDDLLIGGIDDDQIGGGAGNDQLAGNEDNDWLSGGSGNDTLDGGDGNDRLDGGTGDDVLLSAAGDDTLTGGLGSDAFQGTLADLSGDIITDFRPGDRIIFTNANSGSFTFSLSGDTLTYSGGLLTLNTIDGTLSASAALGGGVQITIVRDVANDFNGDGRSDILWRNNNGTLTDWLGQPNGAFAGNGGNFSTLVGNDWTVAGTGDFNGDGRDDILWRNANGTVTDWLGTANGSFGGNGGNFSTLVGNDWTVAGTGDFNGDGRDDILWRHTSGTVTDWLGQSNGAFLGNGGNFSTSVGNSWTIVGTGDFNGDGHDDILWRNSDGTITNWLGQDNGAFIGNGGNFSTLVGTDWNVVATGDFNGDGRDDILWRNDNGTLTNWLGQPNGGFVGNGGNFSTLVGNDWTVASTGDFNGDGRDDILWRNANGTLTDWLGTTSGGFAGNGANFSTAVGNDWQVQSYEYPLL